MSKANTVAQYLSYLRRYARALTGSQTSGDAYVAATLEALVKEPQLLHTEASLRVTIYRHGNRRRWSIRRGSSPRSRNSCSASSRVSTFFNGGAVLIVMGRSRAITVKKVFRSVIALTLRKASAPPLPSNSPFGPISWRSPTSSAA
jgi:hypothetical protein